MRKRTYNKALMVGAGAAAGTMASSLIGRKVIDKVHDKAVKVLMEDLYDENIWELVSSAMRIGLQTVVETNLRASEGKAIGRPMGSPKKFPSLDDLIFSIAQLHVMPTPLQIKVDTHVTIGKKARKPFQVDMPVIIAPMAYGIALSKKARIALAKGAAMAGTASNTGEGPFLPAERKAANILIYQYNRGDWGKTPDIIRQCDAVEIQVGQGTLGGLGHVTKAKNIDKELRKALRYPKGKDAVADSRHPEVQRPEDLSRLVRKLKDISGGVPVGVKMAAGKYLEADLAWLCHAGVDFISMEGAEAATKGSAPIIQDDFGIPLVFAITRAANWLEQNNFKDRVSLIAAGKIRTPGDMLKACALGADACYIGAIALFAMSHTEVLKSLPFEPPTQVVWYDGAQSDQLNVAKSAQYLCNFLAACRDEMGHGIKALGKKALGEVGRQDLMSLNEMIARGCGLPMVYEPYVPPPLSGK
ncbi:MAG: FMN-binding glutamate synthase family protein [Bacillota bacterium]|nr:FMN-binding glutamate synthase family protein [Bacillota bacterium]MDW7684230.1 FMN-binding glutamate synthase family protein [Bacillota bacterium]